ncbi:hypothetical protein BDB01DRAFT_777510 [Pilobolus umbonatus]|nr:hypothetical protein BDB01DRAFT_777510 [Pilobolus umbonatus]
MELPEVGKHCEYSGCHKLDFLSIVCPLCQNTYCGDHRLPIHHQCVEWTNTDKQLIECPACQQLIYSQLSPQETLNRHIQSKCTLYVCSNTPKMDRKCAVDGCYEVDPRVGSVQCNQCNNKYCLKHRYPAHDCLTMDMKSERKNAAEQKITKIFGDRPSAVTKPVKPRVMTPMARKVEMMKIKSKAKGLSSIPQASRIYLNIQPPKESNMATQPVYLDKTMTVGRALDVISDVCKITNNNHMLATSDPKVNRSFV